MEILLPTINMQYGVPSSIWTESELVEVLTGLDKVSAFEDEGGTTFSHKRGINLEGYPLVANLFYRSPNWLGLNTEGEVIVPYPEETVFEVQFGLKGDMRVKSSPLSFQLHPNGDEDMDFTARLIFRLQFGNGINYLGVLESEYNGDTAENTLYDRTLLLPSHPRILSSTGIAFHRHE